MTSRPFGGFGQAALGRHNFGSSESELPPTYYESSPADNAQGIPRTQWIIFTTYYYSSSADIEGDFIVDVSEDGGLTFTSARSPAYEFILRVKDGQQIWCKIRKITDLWPSRTKIVIRCTTKDEFGNEVVKVQPVRWT